MNLLVFSNRSNGNLLTSCVSFRRKNKVYLKKHPTSVGGFLSKNFAPLYLLLRRPIRLISKLVRKVVFSEADYFLFQRVPS